MGRLQIGALVVMGLVFMALGGRAHEQVPAVADLRFEVSDAQLEWRLSIEVNLEAIVAGIGPEHDTTTESPQAARYDALRQLSPEALERVWREMGPRIAPQIRLSAGGVAAGVDFVGAEIPPVGDLALARVTTLHFSGAPMEAGFDAVRWGWSAGLGPVVLRVVRADGADGYTGFLTEGAETQGFDALGEARIGGGVLGWLRGLLPG